jgi:hypothetical protein
MPRSDWVDKDCEQTLYHPPTTAATPHTIIELDYGLMFNLGGLLCLHFVRQFDEAHVEL